MQKVRDRKDLNEDLKDPVFKSFYEITGSAGGQITYEQWKPLAKKVDPDASEDQLKLDFDQADSWKDSSLDLSEYKESMKILETRVTKRAGEARDSQASQ